MLTKEWISNRLAVIPSGAIMEQESHTQILSHGEWAWCCICEKLEGHCGCVVRDTEEIAVDLREVRKAEKRLEAAISAKLDVQWSLAVTGDSGVQGFEDLSRERCACDGSNGIRGVVGKIELMVVGQRTELEEGVIGEKVRGGNSSIVDAGNIEVVEDYYVQMN